MRILMRKHLLGKSENHLETRVMGLLGERFLNDLQN